MGHLLTTSVIILTLVTLVFAKTRGLPVRTENECGSVVETLVLCIETKNRKYVVRDKIPVIIRLKNQTDSDLKLITSSKEYNLEVKNGNNELVSLSEKERSNPFKAFVLARDTVTVKRGGSLEKQMIVTDKYDLSRAGIYKIRVNRRIPTRDGFTEIFSNVIEIEVVDP